MHSTGRRAIIKAVSGYTPDKVLSNKQLEKIVDTTDEWILKRTGIRERRILDKDKPVSYIGRKAVEQILKKTGTSPDEIDLIICGTNTPDTPFPATSIKIAYEEGCHRANAFDIQASCPAFLYALNTGVQFIQTSYYQKVIVLGIDKMSSVVDYEDRRSCILFGDGGGAVLLTSTEDLDVGIIDSQFYSDGKHIHNLLLPAGGSLCPTTETTVRERKHFMFQDGPAVFKEAVRLMPSVCNEILSRNDLTHEDIDYLIPHQANLRIIQFIINYMKIDPEKVLVNIDRLGNTSAGAIPLCLWEWEKKFKKGDRILLTSFGAGYLWGAVYLIWAYDSD